jgi:DNA-binding CsgD family transcriptional regulator
MSRPKRERSVELPQPSEKRWLDLRVALHDLDAEEEPWLREVFTLARPVLDEGAGLFVYSYRIERRSAIRLVGLAGEQTAPRFWGALSAWGADNQATIAALYSPRVGTLGESRRRAEESSTPLSDFGPDFEVHGIRDLVAVVGHDALGAGVVVAAPRTRKVALRHVERRQLDRLAAELGAQARFRARRLASETTRLSAAEVRVARRVLEGASDKDMAREFGCRLSTVSTLARRLRRKLGCRAGEEALHLSASCSSEAIARRLALFDLLSPSECDVLSALLIGARYDEVARWRGTSTRTIAAQATAIFRKAQVSGRRELAAKLFG